MKVKRLISALEAVAGDVEVYIEDAAGSLAGIDEVAIIELWTEEENNHKEVRVRTFEGKGGD